MILRANFLLACLLSSAALAAEVREYSVDFVGGGSDAFRRAGDEAGVFYSITDRGPNVDCTEALEFLAKDPCPGLETGKVFVEPKFNPQILKWKWSGRGKPELLKTVTIKDAFGAPVSGVSNPYFAPEVPYDLNGEVLALDPSGIDPEGLVVMGDGSFWISEEYGPSLLHVAKDGRIIERWIPENLAIFYQDAKYKVVAKLPDVFGMRRANRGFESLTLTPNGKELLLSNQSALSLPDDKVAKKSRVIRILSIDLSTSRVTGMFAYQFDEAKSFEEGAKISDLKVSAMLFHRGDLLLQERTDEVMKIYRVKLGKNILNTEWASLSARKSLEESEPLELMAKKELFWDSRSYGGRLALKIESIVSWGQDSLLLMNDDDFGVTGQTSKLYFLRLNERL